MNGDPQMPSEVSGHIGVFDKFANWAARAVSRAPFFAFCVVLVVLWAPSILILRDINLWQLIINTATTIITFLMVALLQNSQTRADQAVQHKLNAIADALSHFMRQSDLSLDNEVKELCDAVGLERRESTTKNKK